MVSEAPYLEKYLNVRAAYQPSFAPDGQRLGFLSDITGLPQVWAVDTRGGWPDQLTFGDDRVTQLAFSPTDARLVFARDAGGNENKQLFLLYADGSGERPLTVDGGAMHVLGAWSPDGQAIAFAANRRSRRHFDLYLLKSISFGKTTALASSDPLASHPMADVCLCLCPSSTAPGVLRPVHEVEIVSAAACLARF